MKRILTIIAVVAIGLVFFTSCESSIEENKKQYTISVYSHDNSRGTVSGDGTYEEGTLVTLTATANSGYTFKEWNDGNTDNPRVITVTQDESYTAYFEKQETLDKNEYTITVSSNNSSYGSVSGGGTYEEGTLVTLTATANSGYTFKEWNDGNTDNPRVITVTQDESYTAYFEIEETLGKNEYTITVSSNNSSYGSVSGGGTYEEGTSVTLTATANSGYTFKEWNDGNTDNPRVITVTQDESYTAYFEKQETMMNAGHEYVDLGLTSGLKWATCNVGATKPEEYGDYFAWGEVESKKARYSWTTYKYCADANSFTLTKYCSDSYYGSHNFTDNKTVLDPEDDAAAVNWGGTWRMPTKAEQDELRDKCTWTWTTQNGVNGYKVTGPNGNSIFLPAAGYMYGFSLEDVGWCGYYWSSSLDTSCPSLAYYMYFYSDRLTRSNYIRSDGRSVRPVCQ